MVGDPVRLAQEARRLLIAADTLRAADETAAAAAELERALELGALDSTLDAEIRIKLADCYRELNEHESSYRAVGPVLDNPPDDIWRARALVRFARVLFFRGDPDAARAACVNAGDVLGPTSHHVDYAQAQLWLGHSLRMVGDVSETRKALEAAIASARRGGAGWLEAVALSSLGHLEIRCGRLHAAEEVLREALDQGVDVAQRSEIPRVHLHMAVCRLHAGRWADFEQSLAAASQGYRSMGDQKGLALAAVLRARGERLRGQDSARSLDDAEAEAKSSQYARARAHVVEERGLAALDRGEFETARHSFEELLERGRIEAVGEDLNYDARNGLARALAGLGKRSDALEVAQLALRGADKAGDVLAAASVRTTLGLVQGNPAPIEEAIAVLAVAGARCELLRAHRAAAAILWQSSERMWHVKQGARLEAELGLEGGDAEAVADRSFASPAESPMMAVIMTKSRELGAFDGGVLVLGERAVGRAQVAAEIHRASHRPGPFVRVNCRGISRDQIVRELRGEFGRDAGAIERAQGGSLVLEDLDQLDVESQAIIAREIGDDGGGGARPLAVIGTAGEGLDGEARSGSFLPELFALVAGVSITVPPLRERPADVVAAAESWAGGELSGELRQTLCSYDWPGNFVELREAVRAALFSAKGASLSAEHFPDFVREPRARLGLRAMVNELETREIRRALSETAGNKSKAAESLGISRKGLFDRLKRLGLWKKGE